MIRRAKFDAASFILGGEILSLTNTHKFTKKTNSNRYINTYRHGMCE